MKYFGRLIKIACVPFFIFSSSAIALPEPIENLKTRGATILESFDAPQGLTAYVLRIEGEEYTAYVTSDQKHVVIGTLLDGEARNLTDRPGGDSTDTKSASSPEAESDSESDGRTTRRELFEKNPSRSPVFVRDGTRFWRCRLVVTSDIRDEIYTAVRTVANEENMPPPLSSLCRYSRYESNIFGNKSEQYVLSWYVGEPNMRACMRNNCNNFRNAHLIRIDGTLHADIFLTRAATQQVRHACYNVEDRRFRYRNKGCMH